MGATNSRYCKLLSQARLLYLLPKSIVAHVLELNHGMTDAFLESALLFLRSQANTELFYNAAELISMSEAQ